MLMGAAKPLHIEFVHDNTRLKVLDFPAGRARAYGECMAFAREAIRACWAKDSDGVMHLKHTGESPHYNLVRVLAANGREICSWSVVDEQRHG
jgi:hypothetical protein